jgi:L-fuconolactonase
VALVDAHVHVWAADALGPDDALGPAGTVERLLETFDANAVGRGVAVQPSVYGSDHRYLISALAAASGRLAGVALAEPNDAQSVATLGRVVHAPGIRGIRVPLIRAPAEWLPSVGEAVWRLAEVASGVICAFVDPSQLDDLVPFIDRFGDVPVAIDHVARLDLATTRSAALEALLALARYPNVVVKISALGSISREPFPYPNTWSEVRAVVESFGSDRVLWGSDYPPILEVGSYGESLRAVRLALEGLPAEAVQAALGGNALRLFGGDGSNDA